MADTKISNFTNGVTANATDRIAAARSPFTADSDNVYHTIDYYGTYLAKNTLAAGTITTSQPMTLTQTWNAGGVTFVGKSNDITATASAAASLVERWRVGGSDILALVKSGALLGVNGSASAPTYSFANETNSGLSLLTPGILGVFTEGVRIMDWRTAGVYIPSNAIPLIFGASADLYLHRDAADTLAQRNGTAAQTFNIYNTWTDASNYERTTFAWSGNSFYIQTQNAGTGVARVINLVAASQINFGGGGGTQWSVLSTGHLVTTDNTYDIGASGATRPRTGYFGTSLISPTLTATGVLTARSATATPAAASAVASLTMGSALVGIYWGTGSPNTVVTAPKGSLYIRTDGSGIADRMYINTDASTAWTTFATAA